MNTRYDDTPLYTYNNSTPFFGRRITTTYEEWIEHAITQHERIDTIAYKYYGDSTQWWRIAEANPDKIWWPLTLPIGETIKIPVNV